MDIDRTFASSSTTHRCSSPGDRNRPTLSADHICTLCRLSLRMQMKTRGWCSVVSGHAAHVVLSRFCLGGKYTEGCSTHATEEALSQRARLPPWAFPALASWASHSVVGFTDPVAALPTTR